jgi:hypothetical protein
LPSVSPFATRIDVAAAAGCAGAKGSIFTGSALTVSAGTGSACAGSSAAEFSLGHIAHCRLGLCDFFFVTPRQAGLSLAMAQLAMRRLPARHRHRKRNNGWHRFLYRRQVHWLNPPPLWAARNKPRIHGKVNSRSILPEAQLNSIRRETKGSCLPLEGRSLM